MKHKHPIIVLTAACLLAIPLTACKTTQSASNYSILDADENDINSLKKRGDSALKAQKYDIAFNAYKAALHLDGNDNEARYGFAESLLKLGSGEDAIKNYEMVNLQEVPDYQYEVAQGIGLARFTQGDKLGAEEKLLLAVEGDPTLWRAWNGLAQIYDFQKMWEESDLAYSHALEHTTQEEAIYNNLGVSYMAQERFKDAENAFKNALRYDPDLKIAETNYKLALSMQEKYEEATLEGNESEQAKALNNAGYAAMLKGNFTEAEQMFLKAIEISPSFYKTAYSNLQVLHKLKNG